MKSGLKPALIAVPALLLTATMLAQSAGPATYKEKCAMCHAADGSGNTPAGKATKTPSFRSPELLKMPDNEFFADTKDGKGKMPAYSGKLSDREIQDVLAYIRKMQKK